MDKFMLMMEAGNLKEKTEELLLYLYDMPEKEKIEIISEVMTMKNQAYFVIEKGKIYAYDIDDKQEQNNKVIYHTLPCKIINGKEKQRIYFDADGTVAEWGPDTPMEVVFSKGYFLNRPVMENVRSAMQLIVDTDKYNCAILSAYNPDYEYILKDKETWVKKELPFLDEDKCIFSHLAGVKSDFVPFPKEDDVLIDDYNPNLFAWHGIPVKMLNGINSTWTGRIVSSSMDPHILAESIMALAETKILH